MREHLYGHSGCQPQHISAECAQNSFDETGLTLSFFSLPFLFQSKHVCVYVVIAGDIEYCELRDICSLLPPEQRQIPPQDQSGKAGSPVKGTRRDCSLWDNHTLLTGCSFARSTAKLSVLSYNWFGSCFLLTTVRTQDFLMDIQKEWLQWTSWRAELYIGPNY